MSMGQISQKDNKWRKISPEKKTHLGKSCVTMTGLMVEFMTNRVE